ncbi:MAG: hypothetical protein ACLFPL_05145 [Candidatus Nanoarchaeia archaeon]
MTKKKDIENKSELEKLQEFKNHYYELKEFSNKINREIGVIEHFLNHFENDKFNDNSFIYEKVTGVVNSIKSFEESKYCYVFCNNLYEKNYLEDLKNDFQNTLSDKNSFRDFIPKIFDRIQNVIDYRIITIEGFKEIETHYLTSMSLSFHYNSKEYNLNLREILEYNDSLLQLSFSSKFEDKLYKIEKDLKLTNISEQTLQFNQIIALGVVGTLIYYIFNIFKNGFIQYDDTKVFFLSGVFLCVLFWLILFISHQFNLKSEVENFFDIKGTVFTILIVIIIILCTIGFSVV